MFSGSYLQEDVVFLMRPVEMADTPIEQKERLIQSGRRHYSEMITRERLPTPEYLRIFHEAFAQHRRRFARDLLTLARRIAEDRQGEAVIVSLARAGTPVGAVVSRTLRRHFGHEAPHYSVSIIRDRGIDANALRFLLRQHAPGSLVFVDGWTGKGVIAGELALALRQFERDHGVRLEARLCVAADLCGAAAVAATADDYLIPTSMLGCLVSGLVSRSILNREVVGPDDFHGCLYYEELLPHDLSRWLVDELSAEIALLWSEGERGGEGVGPQEAERCRQASRQFLEDAARRFGVRDVNHIKPGVGEATRVLLRRVPDLLLLRDERAAEAAHLVQLAREKRVPVKVDNSLPYRAAALIKELRD